MTASTICPKGWQEVTYRCGDGWQIIYYDPQAPCVWCGFPVIDASSHGPHSCAWCDRGMRRPEQERAYIEALHAFLRARGLWEEFRRVGGW
jgi:hypothetical protein